MADLHLWEVDHPFYGTDDNTNQCDTFADLRETVDNLHEGMNHIYRWDWTDYSHTQHDDLFTDGEDRTEQHLTVFLICPRKSMLINFQCSISHDDEAEVLEWLRGPRVLGALRALWQPLLDEQEASDG